MFLFSDLSCHLSQYMGSHHKCSQSNDSIYYLLLPIFIITILTLFIMYEHRWGKYYSTPTVSHIPERRVSLSSLSSKKKRSDKKLDEDIMKRDIPEHDQMKVEKLIDHDVSKQSLSSQQPKMEQHDMPHTNSEKSYAELHRIQQQHEDTIFPAKSSFDKVTLMDENGTSSIFPITSDTTCHDLLHEYATQHDISIDHVLLYDSHHTLISLELSPPTNILYILPHYQNILEYSKNMWIQNKISMEYKYNKLKTELLITQQGLQQKSNLLMELQSRYDTILTQLTFFKSHSTDSSMMDTIHHHEYHNKISQLELQLAEALKWKTQYKTLEKESQRWKSVVKQSRLREKSLERDVKEMHHWRQRARAFEKEVKELRLMKRHVMEMRAPTKSGSISVPRLDVHHIQQHPQHVIPPPPQQQQHQPPQSSRMYPPYHFPTVIPSQHHSQSLPVTARGNIPSRTTTPTQMTSTHVTPPPTSPPIIQQPTHSRRLTIGSSQQLQSTLPWNPSLSTPLFDFNDSAPSSTSVSPMLQPSIMDDDIIHGLVLNDDDGDMEPQLPLNLSSDDGSENDREA